ncbi:MAG: AAA family ATPase [Planctomycetota bacterium]|nr:AAA family ATPase [Planctomycetota bacterium]MDA1211955.1 AAA family ATPase [Planctomycetota bacterium]
MYERYWGFQYPPFRETHDPVWYFASPAHEEAQARLLYVIERHHQAGWLIGPLGTGKSLLLHVLADKLHRSAIRSAYLDMAGMDAEELVWNLSSLWQVARSMNDSLRVQWRRLQDVLESQQMLAEPAVILLDHIDRADPDCFSWLERLRQLRTPNRSIPACTLILSTENRQTNGEAATRDRCDFEAELFPVEEELITEYIEARIRVANGRVNPFSVDAVSEIASLSDGVPSRINQLCELSLLAAMGNGLRQVDDQLVIAVADDLMRKRQPVPRSLQTTH